ncbi:MAG: pyruvate kinase [Chitinispirillaceae bacterium]|nr:pyruvate kinase [Chitinispirillaceae bacterium]
MGLITVRAMKGHEKMRKSAKKIKIIATVGPSSRNAVIIKRLILAGVNVFRLNFSHGDHTLHLEAIRNIREASARLRRPVAILADLQGPKIRTGKTLGDRPVTLKKGSAVTLSRRKSLCDERLISVDYKRLAEDIGPGQKIMINDGAIRLAAKRVDRRAGRVECVVESGGVYRSRKGINLPNVVLGIPSLTPKDRADLHFILGQDVQYVALSFVRSAADIRALRAIVDGRRPDMKIVAKIEKPEAAASIDSILDIADGIMVARGDLGVEASPHEVPVLQKMLVARANASGKIVIVATQMLESMIRNPLPTRAESSDVANAIFDGADAIMLSGETAVGAFPVETAAMMADIAEAAEESPYGNRELKNPGEGIHRASHAVCEAAAWASRDLGGTPVCVFTLSGDTAFYMSKIRVRSPVYAFSPKKNVVDMLSLAWNVFPFQLSYEKHMADLLLDAEKKLLQQKLVAKGDLIVVVSGTSPVKGATNVMRIKRAGER